MSVLDSSSTPQVYEDDGCVWTGFKKNWFYLATLVACNGQRRVVSGYRIRNVTPVTKPTLSWVTQILNVA